MIVFSPFYVRMCPVHERGSLKYLSSTITPLQGKYRNLKCFHHVISTPPPQKKNPVTTTLGETLYLSYLA